MRRESVERLQEKAGVDREHTARVREIALRLFDRTHALHQLAAREREWLQHAATLHDIGRSIAYERHHRHSAYLVEHGGLKGFSAEEVRVLALLARHHRGARPRRRHLRAERLDPWLCPVVMKLTVLLRLAVALDRGHRQVVESVDVRVTRRKLHLTLVVSGDADLELWAVGKKARQVARVFRRKLVVRVAAVAAEAAEAAAVPATPAG